MENNARAELKSEIQSYIDQRISEFSPETNSGPGDSGHISQITLGFDCEEETWIALIFDTRNHPEIDGEWNSYIEQNKFDLPNINVDRSEHLISTLGGLLVEITKNIDVKSLETTKNCFITVEHHEGCYAWSSIEKSSSSDQYLKLLDQGAKGLSNTEKVDYWISVLQRVATGREAQMHESAFLADNHALDRLKLLSGSEAALLEFVKTWAFKSEWIGDYPSDLNFEDLDFEDDEYEIEETPYSEVMCSILNSFYEINKPTKEIETLLLEIIELTLVPNKQRKLWGIAPVLAARCLYKNYSNYPEPDQCEDSNKLVNASSFMSS